MQISGSFVQNMLASVRVGTGAGTVGGSSALAAPPAAGSVFGPAATVSLSGTRGRQATSRFVPTPQLDLSSLIGRNNQTQAAVSPRVQKQEAAALKQVAALVDQNRFGEARGVLDSVLKKNPTSGPAVHALGVIELEERNYDVAERLFQKADFLAPELGYDQDRDVARYLQQDDEEAFAAAKRLSASADTRAVARGILVGLTRRSPLHTEARLLLAEEMLRKRDAVSGLAQYRLAILTADDEQLRGIESRLGELVEMAPKAAFVRRLLGQTQLRLGKNQQAADTLAQASELADGDPRYRAEEAPAHIAIGREKLAQRDIAGAIGSFEYARSLDYGSPEVRVALGEGYLARGEQRVTIGALSAAIGDFQVARSKLRDASDPALRERLARAAFTAGLRLDAVHRQQGAKVGDEASAFQIAYDLDRDNVMYRTRLAVVRNRSGDEYMADSSYKNAAGAYQRAYDLASSNATYRDNAVAAYTLWGDELADQVQYTDAIAAYESAYEIQRSDALALKLGASHNERGLQHLNAGRMSDARADFRQALEYEPENADYQANYDSTL